MNRTWPDLFIHEAKKAGTDAVKLQTYTPDTLTNDVSIYTVVNSHTHTCA